MLERGSNHGRERQSPRFGQFAIMKRLIRADPPEKAHLGKGHEEVGDKALQVSGEGHPWQKEEQAQNTPREGHGWCVCREAGKILVRERETGEKQRETGERTNT